MINFDVTGLKIHEIGQRSTSSLIIM